jgi:hypothetical protein
MCSSHPKEDPSVARKPLCHGRFRVALPQDDNASRVDDIGLATPSGRMPALSAVAAAAMHQSAQADSAIFRRRIMLLAA